MKEINYTPHGVCARSIKVVLDDNNIIQDVIFVGGCDGNHRGLVALLKGMKAEEAKDQLWGTPCGPRNPSCPDQVAKALDKALSGN